MVGSKCTVVGCGNTVAKSKKEGSNVRFHSLPLRDKDRCRIWIKNAGMEGKWSPGLCIVCSIHFREVDYERDLKAELLNLPPKRKLKSTAVPLLHLPISNPETVDGDTDIENKKPEVLQRLEETSSCTDERHKFHRPNILKKREDPKPRIRVKPKIEEVYIVTKYAVHEFLEEV